MKRYQLRDRQPMLVKFTVFRSGYTGEDGVEIDHPGQGGAAWR